MQQTIRIAKTNNTIQRVIKDRQIRYNHNRYLVSETGAGNYIVDLSRPIRSPLDMHDDDEIVAKAYSILEQRALDANGEFLESPDAVKKLFQLRHSGLTHETFDVAFLDNRHRLRFVKTIFTGTIDSCSVYPRRILECCLKADTPIAAILLSHGHPSGIPEPSRADLEITKKLQKALSYCDIRILDHIITADRNAVSLAERGEI